MTFKFKYVLFCGEVTDSSKCIINELLKQNIKQLVVVNSNQDSMQQLDISDKRLSHYAKSLQKTEDLEDVFKETLKRTKKKVDLIVNHRDLNASTGNWEDVITMHINALICSTLMAIKHLGSMNAGGGGTVVNSITMLDCVEDCEANASVRQLLSDLDRSFSDPYYFNNTAVQIFTMFTRAEIARDQQLDQLPTKEAEQKEDAIATSAFTIGVVEDDANPSGSASASGSSPVEVNNLTGIFMDVLKNKRSYLDEPTDEKNKLEPLEISVVAN